MAIRPKSADLSEWIDTTATARPSDCKNRRWGEIFAGSGKRKITQKSHKKPNKPIDGENSTTHRLWPVACLTTTGCGQ
jgi:hypothetical protein